MLARYNLLIAIECLLLQLACCLHLRAATSSCCHLCSYYLLQVLPTDCCFRLLAAGICLLLPLASYNLLHGLPLFWCYSLLADHAYLLMSLTCMYCLLFATNCSLLQPACCYLVQMQPLACKLKLTLWYQVLVAKACWLLPLAVTSCLQLPRACFSVL